MALCAVALCGLPATAGENVPDGSVSNAVGADTTGQDAVSVRDRTRDEASADPLVVQLKSRAPGYFDKPVWVMMRSAVVPGWGQVHNRAWIKGLAIAGGEVFLAMRLLDDRRELDDLVARTEAAQLAGDDDLEELLVTQHNDRLNSYIGRQWWMAGLLAYSLLDAYIDAYFRDFGVGFRGDPALPGGRPPSGGAQLYVRMRF